jgi:hypothetical protein
MTKDEVKIGGAVLGLYAAIQVCTELGIDIRELLASVERHLADEQKLRMTLPRPDYTEMQRFTAEMLKATGCPPKSTIP